ncbi:hypothetical protein T484DRAFT_2960630 [Baffinella frigidus]|nr:hypothetical protein T484DRAFT_2960630 [Cryptophyta sp. CCMP2293]
MPTARVSRASTLSRSVMRAMATQKKEEESNAQAKALKQYWGRIRSSISDQKQQRHHLAGESALRETEEDDKAERLQKEASSARLGRNNVQYVPRNTCSAKRRDLRFSRVAWRDQARRSTDRSI